MLRYFIAQLLRATNLLAATLIGTSVVVSASAEVASADSSNPAIAQPVQVAVIVDQDAAVRNKRSDIGVYECIDRNSFIKTGLSIDVVRRMCVGKHSIKIDEFSAILEGTGSSLRITKQYAPDDRAVFKNTSNDRIITRRTVSVSLENVKGFNDAVEFNDLSILPDEEQTIKFPSLKNRDSANNLDLGRVGWGWSTSGGMLRLRATY